MVLLLPFILLTHYSSFGMEDSIAKHSLGTYIANGSGNEILGIARIRLNEQIIDIEPINRIPPSICTFFQNADSLQIINGVLIIDIEDVTPQILQDLPPNTFLMNFEKLLMGRKDKRGFMFVPEKFIDKLFCAKQIPFPVSMKPISLHRGLSNGGVHAYYVDREETTIKDANQIMIYANDNQKTERRWLQRCDEIPTLLKLCISYIYYSKKLLAVTLLPSAVSHNKEIPKELKDKFVNLHRIDLELKKLDIS